TNHPVVSVEPENLFELLDVRTDIIMAEHHSFRITGAATGENHGREVIKLDGFGTPERTLQHANRCQAGESKRGSAFDCARIGSDILQEQCLNPDLQFHLLQKRPGSEHGLDLALAYARTQRFL